MTELMIPLSNDLKEPLYEQIYDYIRVHIADGKISCGEKLPSTRLLSKHLQVSRSTVSLAYEQLLSEGYLTAKRGSGYYVGDLSDLYVSGRVKQENQLEGQKKAAGKKEKPYRIVFSPDENEFSYFPYNTWRRISKETLSANDPSVFCAGEAAGEWELREAIREYLYHARGVNCSLGQIIVGAGNEYLLILLAQILGSKKRVAIENPTYLRAYQTLFHMGYKMLAVERDRGGIRMEEIRSLAPDVIYTMPSHQFPMGTVMPMKRRLELLQWCAGRKDCYIVEDDHDSEFRYKGKPIPSLQGMDLNGTVIYLGTFSKSISPAIRVSYMVLPERLLDLYNLNCGFYASTVSKEQQRVLAAFMRQGGFERYLNKMRRVYKAKHDRILSLLKKEAWVRTIYGDYAGIHLLVELNTKKSAKWVVDRAKEHGVRVYDLEEYKIPGTSFAKDVRPTLLLGYGALGEDEMQEGIACIRRILGNSEE